MKTTCINHPKNEPILLIRWWQLVFCEGNYCAAALLSFFEYWHNIKLEMKRKNQQLNDIAEMHGDERSQDETLIQFHTEGQLRFGILFLYSNKAIREALKLLEAKGVIETTSNPNPKYKFDKTKYFIFHPEVINEWLAKNYPGFDIFIEEHDKEAILSGKTVPPFGKNASPSGKNTSPCGKNTSPNGKNAERCGKNASPCGKNAPAKPQNTPKNQTLSAPIQRLHTETTNRDYILEDYIQRLHTEKENNISISSPYGEEILSSNPNSFSSSNADSLSNCKNSSSFRAGCFFNNADKYTSAANISPSVNNNTLSANSSFSKESVTTGEYIPPSGNNNPSLDEKDSFRESDFSTTGSKYILGSNNNNTPSAKRSSLSKEGVPLDGSSNNNQPKRKSTNNADSNIPTESDNNNPPVEDTSSSEKTKKTGRSKKDDIPYEEIINYLNEKTGKHFKASTKATRRLIHARWSEGFRLEDFKRVIDNKVADWKDNPEMSKYLRPQTLFGTKFEAYLNQTPAAQKKQPAPADGVPYEEIVSLYNRILPELPPAKVLNEKRKRLIAERWQEDPERQNLSWWENFFRHVRKSGFLMGLVIRKGQKPFKADFDWLLQEDHFIHVLEGRYHGPIAGVDIGEKALLTMKVAESLITGGEDEEPQERLY